jgi:hypothetical protein
MKKRTFKELSKAEKRILHLLYDSPPDEWVTINTLRVIKRSLRWERLILVDASGKCKISPIGSALVEEYIAFCKAAEWRRKPKAPKQKYLCPACKTEERHTSKTGARAPYCRNCQRQKYHDKQVRLYERVQAGEEILCTRCKVAPIHCKNGVGAYICLACMRQRNTDHKRKRLKEKLGG